MSYLAETLDSLADFSPLVVHDLDNAGSYPTLLKALRTLLKYRAEAYAVFQDDVLVSNELRTYLDRALWPEAPEQIGMVSCYTPGNRHQNDFGWFKSPTETTLCGGLAMIFPAHAAEKLATNPPNTEFKTNSDQCVGLFCRREGLSWWEHSPSLAMHIGWISSIGPRNRCAVNPRSFKQRQCREFVPDLALPSVRMGFDSWQA